MMRERRERWSDVCCTCGCCATFMDLIRWSWIQDGVPAVELGFCGLCKSPRLAVMSALKSCSSPTGPTAVLTVGMASLLGLAVVPTVSCTSVVHSRPSRGPAALPRLPVLLTFGRVG